MPAKVLASFLACSAIGLIACYRAHERIASVDASVADAGSDAPPIDLGPVVCDSLEQTHDVTLGAGVTPRMVALPNDELGIVYVHSGDDNTDISYERLGRGLERLSGEVDLPSNSFSWTEIVRNGDSLWIAYGNAGDSQSSLQHLSFDGSVLGGAVPVSLYHPNILQVAAANSLLWVSFEMEAENLLRLSHIDFEGRLLHPNVEIPTGSYGSAHSALAREDGSHILAYSGEGPPGMRHGHLRSFSGGGSISPDRVLDSDADDRALALAWVADSIAIVRATESDVVVERRDATSFDASFRTTLELGGSQIAATTVAGRLVVIQARSTQLQLDFFTEDLSSHTSTVLPITSGSIGSGLLAVGFRDAVALAFGTTRSDGARPTVIRVECRAGS